MNTMKITLYNKDKISDGLTFVGIDPAYRKNGFSICLIKDNIISYVSMKNGFIDYVFWLKNIDEDLSKFIFCVENSRLQNVSFDKKGGLNIAVRKARNVGMNQAISQCTVDYTKCFCPNVFQISPKDKGKKWSSNIYKSMMKVGAMSFPSSRSNQDQRDAFKLALIAKSKWSLIE